MKQNFTQFAFTDSVKAAQEEYGSRKAYQRMEDNGPDQSEMFQREMAFISQRDSFYMSTVGENGWPYVQFRGGPKGFLKVLDQQTLAYADFRGNMQYISTGNIKANRKTALILLDYPTRTRLKVWAESEILNPDEHPDLLEKLTDPNYTAKIERIVVFRIQAYDWNCPQHITPKFTIDEFKALVKEQPELLNEFSNPGAPF